MAAGIEIYNYVTNQKGSPALYSDVLANRPAAGFIGRLFISTDTLEIYRDNGTTWDLISGGGGGVNIYNSDGSLTGARTMTMANHNLTFEGGANPARLIISANNNVAKIFQFRTANVARWDFRVDDNETGGDTGSNWHLRAHNDAGAFTFNPISVTRSNGEKSFYAQENLTAGTEALAGVFNISAGTYGAGLTFIGGNAHAAQFNNFTIANGGSFTFASSSFVGASGNVLRVQANASGTVTMTPSTPGIRTAAVMLNQIQYNTSGARNLVYTHAANIQTLGILQLITDGSFTVTNAYGVIINDLNEYGNPSVGPGALILTNRWGIYQDSTVDVNYFGGTTLIGTTTNAGYKLDVAGTLRNTLGANFATTSGNVGIGTASPAQKLQVVQNATSGRLDMTNIDRTSSALIRITNPEYSINASSGILLRVFPDSDARQGAGIIASGGGSNGETNLDLFVSQGTSTSTSFSAIRIAGNNGNVGIGTTNPVSKLNLQQSASTFGDGITMSLSGATIGTNFLDSVTNTYNFTRGGASGTGLALNSSSEVLIATTSDAGDYKLQVAGNQYLSGRLVVGTTTDSGQTVQINSSLRLIPTSTVPTASAGTLYYDTATNKLKLYDGTSWVDLN
jgi:hypothetical protein